MKGYLVNEHFAAFQGEGCWSGHPAHFIRLHGCDQACKWCDAAGTWHPRFNDSKRRMTVGDLVAEIHPLERMVVVTGGEPCLQDLRPLTDGLRAAFPDARLHLETAGHVEISGEWDWITLSPKIGGKHPLASSVRVASEFKVIVDAPGAVAANMAVLRDLGGVGGRVVWLHPEWSRRDDDAILGEICEAVRASLGISGLDVRAGLQSHKHFRVDVRDPRADQRTIPLGGTHGNSR